MKRYTEKGLVCITILFLLCLMTSCGEKQQKVTTGSGSLVTVQKEEAEQEEKTIQSELYCIVGINRETEQIAFKKLNQNGEHYYYCYTSATYILDKYGKNTTVDALAIGDVVEIKVSAKNGVVDVVQMSDEVWVNEEITGVSVNEKQQMITFDGSRYYYDDEVLVVFRGKEIELEDVSPLDELRITGEGKKIHTIVVTRGHGAVVFENTEIFEGGYCTIGNVMSTKVEEGLKVEVRAGTYKMTIANSGYGGNCEVKVKAGKITKLDLSELAELARKKGTISFSIKQDDVEVKVNGKTVDTSEPLTLEYGTYTIQAIAEGYEDWIRVLVLSSEKALIPIDMEEAVSGETTQVDENGETQEQTTTQTQDDEEESRDNSNVYDWKEIYNSLTGNDLSDLSSETSSLINDVFNALTGSD